MEPIVVVVAIHAAIFWGAIAAFLLSHLILMPIFLRRVKKHAPLLHDSINVAWFNIFRNVASANMFIFLFRRRYRELPNDMHRLGDILRYSWAFGFLTIIVAMSAGLLYPSGVWGAE